MAFKLLTGAGAGVSSIWKDVRSVGSKLMAVRVIAEGNNDVVTVSGSPISTGASSITLGTIAAGGGSLVVDEPISYLKATTGAAESGSPDIYLETSR